MHLRVGRDRLLLVAGGILAALVVLEAGLQLAAWIRWSSGPEVAVAPGERVVLCAGDSHTYGLEATDGASYPAQLEPILNGSGTGRWKVVNGGWPGQDSWDVLRKLPTQLAEWRPEFVLVEVGVNDFWNRPRLHSLAEAKGARPSGSFPLQWRTGRLVSLLRERLRPTAGGGGEAAVFLGDWHLRGIPLRFEGDGLLWVWPREFRWSMDGDRLTVADSGGWRWEARWKKAHGGIELLPVSAGDALLLEKGPLPGFQEGPLGAHVPIRFREGLAALSAGILPRAVLTLEAIGRHAPEFVQARGALAYALVKAGRAAEAAELRERLTRLYEQGRDPRVFEAAMTALAPLPEEEGARRALAADFVGQTAEGLASFPMLAAQGFLGHDLPSARGLVDEVLALLPAEAAERRANLLRARAHLLARGDPAGALRDVVEAFRLDGSGSLAAQAILSHPDSISAEVLDEGLRSPDVEPGLRRRLEEAFREIRGEEGPAMEVLEGHLREIVALCREGGARPALVSYWRSRPSIESVQERVSRETGAAWVHIRTEFDRLLARAGREVYVAPGGHPNNAGYGVVARLVADDLLRSLPNR